MTSYSFGKHQFGCPQPRSYALFKFRNEEQIALWQ